MCLNRCKKCKGAKINREKSRIEFYVERGAHPGSKIVLPGQGDESVRLQPVPLSSSLQLKTNLSPRYRYRYSSGGFISPRRSIHHSRSHSTRNFHSPPSFLLLLTTELTNNPLDNALRIPARIFSFNPNSSRRARSQSEHA